MPKLVHFMSTAISIISNKCSSSQHACDKDFVVCFPVWDKRFERLKTLCMFTAIALPEFTSNLKILVRAKTRNKGHPVPMYLKSHSNSKGQPGGHAPQVKLKDPAASGSSYRCRASSSVSLLLYLLSDSSYTHEGGS